MVENESKLHSPRVCKESRKPGEMSPLNLPVSSPAVVELHLFCDSLPTRSVSWLLAMSNGVRGAGVRLRVAFHRKAKFIPRGVVVGFPSDTIVPYSKLHP